MSNYKLTVDLEQYTPLLHFQGEQSGACLRASEVKPKLDRFVMSWLVKHCDNIPLAWGDREQWDKNTIENVRRTSLRYKMSFQTESKLAPPTVKADVQKTVFNRQKGKEETRIEKNIHGLYFGAMGDENFGPDKLSRIKAVTYSNVSMDVLCMVPDRAVVNGIEMTLIQVLKKLIPPFFALHCFGTRSNKGFGSFGVKGCTVTPEELKFYIPERALYYTEYTENDPSEYYLDDVSAISAVMKAGFNYGNGAYDPGFVRKYSRFAGYHSEKALIKQKLLVNPTEDKRVAEAYDKNPVSKDGSFLYKRAVLGVAGMFQYRGNRRGTVTVQGKKVARFGNPIHYKPYGKYLLLIPQPIPKAVLGEKFAMSEHRNEVVISAPEQFDVVHFMDCFIEHYRTNRKEFISKLKNSKFSLARTMQASFNRCASITKVSSEEVTKHG